jgi:hypothetical protein
MDDFIVYGNTYQEPLDNLEKFLIRCQKMNLSLSHEKCKMLLTEGVVLGHHVSFEGIKSILQRSRSSSNFHPPRLRKR